MQRKKTTTSDNLSFDQNYSFENDCWTKNELVCGIDEVGRGCLAGPVVTAAAILHPHTTHPLLIDSKKLSPQNLLKCYDWLINHCTFAIALGSHDQIDQHNIYRATQMTMQQALLHLMHKTSTPPSLILVDAMPLTYPNIPVISMTKGESKSASIAAASIIAKVTRDAIITRIGQSFPAYQFDTHKSYGTSQHLQALQTFGPSIMHRQTFLKNFLTKTEHEQQSIFC